MSRLYPSNAFVGLEQRLLGRWRATPLAPGATILVGFSGGPDSLALALALGALARRGHLRPVLLHVDHRLRAGSGAEQGRARELAGELGLPFLARHIPGVGQARHPGLGIEEAMRRERYRCFAAARAETGAAAVALAHHAEDQAETVLLHLLRGAGVSGAAAMGEWSEVAVPWWVERADAAASGAAAFDPEGGEPGERGARERAAVGGGGERDRGRGKPRPYDYDEDDLGGEPAGPGRGAERPRDPRGAPKIAFDTASDVFTAARRPMIPVWRPFLSEPKAELRAYVERSGLRPIADPSNDDLRYRRNAVRHDLLPVLERIVPGATLALARYAAVAAEDDATLERLAAEIGRAATAADGGLTDDALADQPAAMRRRVVRWWLRERFGLRSLSFERTKAVLGLLERREGRRAVEIGDGFRVERTRRGLRVRPPAGDDGGEGGDG